jgi:2-C-methyl-D-erythritol 4-phosphate cytidylyltransferase
MESDAMKIAVILPAAGLGRRFNATTSVTEVAGISAGSKVEAELAGKPVFIHAIERFSNRPQVGQIILAVNPDRVDEFTFRHGDKLSFLGVTIVAGGRKERWETVQKALAAVHEDCTHVAIHDAARPLTSDGLIGRVFEAARTCSAVIPGQPVSSTLKRTIEASPPGDAVDDILGDAGKTVPSLRQVTQTVDRSDLVEVQTPQVFELNLLRRAYANLTDGKGITDDAGLVEAIGEPVYVVEGESTNLKITRPEDMKLAQAIISLSTQTTQAAARRKLFGDDDE